MVRQFKPLPPDLELAPTLAQRVNQLREYRNLTVKDLAHSSRFSVQRVEDIEAGLETWLSSSDRQLLAKALQVEPYVIQEVERRSGLHNGPSDREAELTDAILQGARDLECPNCGGTLKCSLQDAFDIDGSPTVFAKAYCMKCPFTLK